jgi:CHAT domain-containing protein
MNGQIFQALGQSVAYDDFRGNFDRARQISQQWLEQARQTGDPSELAEALIWRGIVHIMQGELLAAMECTAEVGLLAPQDANLGLRALTYELLATHERFNSYPDGSGAGATEISARWRGASDLQPADARWHDLLRQATDPQAQNEAWLVYAFLCNLKPGRSILEGSRYVPSTVSRDQMLQTVLNTPVRVQQSAQASSLPGLAAYADWCAANLCHRAGEQEMAQQFLERAQLTYQQAHDPAGVATCLMERADWQCAPFSTPVAWNLALQDSSSEGSHLSIQLEADEFNRPSTTAIDGARQWYAEAERFFQQADAPRGLSALQLRQGYLAMLDDRYAVAAQCADQASAGFEKCGDCRGSFLAQTHLIMSRIGAGQWTETPRLAREVGEWGAQQGGFSFTLGLGLMLNRFARHWLIRKGDYERSLAAYHAAQTLFEALGAPVNAAQSIVDQAVVYQAIGERLTALTRYEQALDLHTEDINARPQIADNLRQRVIFLASNVFQLYLQQMNADGMERSAARLTAQIAQLPGGGEAGALLGVLADQLSAMMSNEAGAASAELPAGIEFWSLRQLAQSNIEISSVLAPLYRSRWAREAGDAVRAKELLAQAVAALPQVGEAQRHFLEVAVLAEQQQFAQAAAAFRRHLQQGGADAGFVGKLTNAMQAVGGEHGAAEARLQQQRTHEQAFSVFVRAKAFAEAKLHLDALEQLAGKQWWAQDAKPWQPLSDCAEMYEGLDDVAAALAYYDQAITQIEARRGQLSRDELKTAIAADKGAQYLYFQAARAAMKQGNHARSFDYAERGKARGLLDLMAGSAVIVRAPETESAAMRSWRQLNAQLTLRRGLLAQERGKPEPNATSIEQFTRQIAVDEDQLRQIEAELALSNPNFQQAVSVEAKTLALDGVVAALPAGAAMLEYFFLAGDLLAWAITPEGLKRAIGVSLDTDTLARDIRAFHRACETRAYAESLGTKLAETLLTPFTDVIRASSRLIIVPYGAAHALPFQALPFEGEPLGAACAVSYLPSASVVQFLHLDGARTVPDRILAVGNPTLNLPAAATEAAFVASLFGQPALLGEAATERAVRERIPDCPLLHFATHGKLSEAAPLSSAIALAHGEELTVYELMGLRLNAELVVLSACNTGQGETTGGDDVLGLTRGLLGAGARAAVVSLWPVDDVSTSLLMGELYRHLRAGDAPAVALRAAQTYLRNLEPADVASELDKLKASLESVTAPLATLQSVAEARPIRSARPVGGAATPNYYRHPYYWAPFILVG